MHRVKKLVKPTTPIQLPPHPVASAAASSFRDGSLHLGGVTITPGGFFAVGTGLGAGRD